MLLLNNFQPTTNQREYEKHVILYIQINQRIHQKMIWKKNNLKSQGKIGKFK